MNLLSDEARNQPHDATTIRRRERVKPWDTPEWQEAIDAQVAKFPKRISARAALHLAFLLGLCDEYGKPLPQPETEPETERETGIGDEKEPAPETAETGETTE